MREIPITCPKCKKQGTIPISDIADPQTAIFKCSCGWEMQLEGDLHSPKNQKLFGELNDVLGKVPEILERFRQTKMESVDMGVGKLMCEEAQKVAARILKEDPAVRADFERAVDGVFKMHIASLLQMIHDQDNGQEED